MGTTRATSQTAPVQSFFDPIKYECCTVGFNKSVTQPCNIQLFLKWPEPTYDTTGEIKMTHSGFMTCSNTTQTFDMWYGIMMVR